jgi:hypothetical protein
MAMAMVMMVMMVMLVMTTGAVAVAAAVAVAVAVIEETTIRVEATTIHLFLQHDVQLLGQDEVKED